MLHVQEFLSAGVDTLIADANMTLCQADAVSTKWRGQTRSFRSLTIWLVRFDKSFEFWDAAVGASWGVPSRVFAQQTSTQSNHFFEMFIAAVLPG
jgi:hypothetical protein